MQIVESVGGNEHSAQHTMSVLVVSTEIVSLLHAAQFITAVIYAEEGWARQLDERTALC